MEKMIGSHKGEWTQILRGFPIQTLFFRAKARKILDFLLKHRDLNPIKSTLRRRKSILRGFESLHFLLRIDRAVFQNFSAAPLDL
jgi:hypothetical protein